MKYRKIVLLFFVLGLITFFILNLKFFIVPNSTHKVLEINNPKICSTYLPYEDNSIIVIGGYNKKGFDKDVEIYNLNNKEKKNLYKSNFNNSYGNFSVVFLNKNNEKVLINVQPVSFKKEDKTGVEIYNFTTNKVKLINLPVKKRTNKDNVRYSLDKYDNKIQINIMDNTKLLEKITYDGEGFKYEKETMYASNFGFKDNIALGGKKDDIVLNTIYYPLNHEHLRLFHPVQNPEVYEIKNVGASDGFNQLLVFGNNDNLNTLELISIEEYITPIPYNLPNFTKNTHFAGAVYLNENELLGFFEKEKNTYKVLASGLSLIPEIKPIGRVKNEYMNKKYILINNSIYQIGGIKTKTHFNCGDAIQDDMEITGAVNFVE